MDPALNRLLTETLPGFVKPEGDIVSRFASCHLSYETPFISKLTAIFRKEPT